MKKAYLKSLKNFRRASLLHKALLLGAVVVGLGIVISSYFLLRYGVGPLAFMTIDPVIAPINGDKWYEGTQISNVKTTTTVAKNGGAAVTTVKYTETDPKTKASVDKTITTAAATSPTGDRQAKTTVTNTKTGQVLVERQTNDAMKGGQLATTKTIDVRTNPDGTKDTYETTISYQPKTDAKTGQVTTTKTEVTTKNGDPITQNGTYLPGNDPAQTASGNIANPIDHAPATPIESKDQADCVAKGYRFIDVAGAGMDRCVSPTTTDCGDLGQNISGKCYYPGDQIPNSDRVICDWTHAANNTGRRYPFNSNNCPEKSTGNANYVPTTAGNCQGNAGWWDGTKCNVPSLTPLPGTGNALIVCKGVPANGQTPKYNYAFVTTIDKCPWAQQEVKDLKAACKDVFDTTTNTCRPRNTAEQEKYCKDTKQTYDATTGKCVPPGQGSRTTLADPNHENRGTTPTTGTPLSDPNHSNTNTTTPFIRAEGTTGEFSGNTAPVKECRISLFTCGSNETCSGSVFKPGVCLPSVLPGQLKPELGGDNGTMTPPIVAPGTAIGGVAPSSDEVATTEKPNTVATPTTLEQLISEVTQFWQGLFPAQPQEEVVHSQ